MGSDTSLALWWPCGGLFIKGSVAPAFALARALKPAISGASSSSDSFCLDFAEVLLRGESEMVFALEALRARRVTGVDLTEEDAEVAVP